MLAPGATVGIIGGGQLGKMLAIAAATLGYRTHVLCPDPQSPALAVAAEHTIAPYEDTGALHHFSQSVDVITFEFENIAHAPLMALMDNTPVRPHPDILARTQHRVQEKDALQALDVPTAAYAAVTSAETLAEALHTIGTPAVLKTARMGYDGKGQVKIDQASNAATAWQQMHTSDAILERWITYRMELSVLVARTPSGQCLCYEPVENRHAHHILASTHVPAPLDASVAERAIEIATMLAQHWQLEGLMAIEMFLTHDGQVLVNEIAPRPHNSGHWTLDACTTSQFEQAIRAVCDLPLGSTRRLCPAIMENLIGEDVLRWQEHLHDPHVKLHVYGKDTVRTGRKMGHITRLLPDEAAAQEAQRNLPVLNAVSPRAVPHALYQRGTHSPVMMRVTNSCTVGMRPFA